MPVFTGRLKLDSGSTAEDIQNSKQNYDMSIFKMSAATSKPRGDHQGEGRGRGGLGGNRGAAANNDDDDFEVVTDKKRGGQRKKDFGDSDLAFGEKASF